MKQNRQQEEAKTHRIDFKSLKAKEPYNEVKMEEIPNKFIEERPWGNFEQFCLNTPCTVKIINVNPHSALSLQYHNNRNEFWKVLDGIALIIIGDSEELAFKGDEFLIPVKTKHQIKTEMHSIQIMEISFGKFDEDDIVRLNDIYGRV